MRKWITSIVAGTAIVGSMAVGVFSIAGNAGAQSVQSARSTALIGAMAAPQHGGPGKNLDAVSTVLGLTSAELQVQLKAGKTLAQVATAQGIAVQRVIDVIVAQKRAYVAQEVASGELTQAQADAKLADVTTKVTEMVNTVRPARSEGGRGGRGGPGKNLDAVSTVLGLTSAELRTQLDAGKTLAQVATTQGVVVQRVIDVIVAEMRAHVAQEVASGELTQAQADAKLADVTTKVTEMVNTVRPAHSEGERGGRGGHGRGNRQMEGTSATTTNA